MSESKLKDIEFSLGKCIYKDLKYKPDFIYFDFTNNMPNSTPLHFELASAHSKDNAIALAWISPGMIYRTEFNFNTAPGWGAPSTVILSGVGSVSSVGLLYSKCIIKGGWKAIPDHYASATKSSMTIKWIVDNFFTPQSRVLDPFANENALLATWCRRYCINYLGYFDDESKLKKAQKVISQIELPFKQESLEYAKS